MAGKGSASRALKGMLAAILVLFVIAGVAGFIVFRMQTPVSSRTAIERFRAGNDEVTSAGYEVDPAPLRRGRTHGGRARASSQNTTILARRATSIKGSVETGAPLAQTSSLVFDVMPAEGVYAYVGSGKEGIWPYERSFGKSTHRIVTHEDRDTWLEHHIFSEERASWTRITTSDRGRLIQHQRNYIKVGTYEEDKTFPFLPPIQAVRFPPQVGQAWVGEFNGKTNDGDEYTGTYAVRMAGDERWNIGGTRTRVLGFEFEAVLEGEFNGTISVDYWFSPRYGLTVREEYSADAKVGPLEYHGEWFVELESLIPRT